MDRPVFAGKLLSLPRFADEAEYQLGIAADRADALRATLDAAAARLRTGEAPKRVAFDLVVAEDAFKVLAALAELPDADRAYVHSALGTPESHRDAIDGIVERLAESSRLQSGLRDSVPGLDEIRLMGPRFEVDVTPVFAAHQPIRLTRRDTRTTAPRGHLEAVAPAGQRALWTFLDRAATSAIWTVLNWHQLRPGVPPDGARDLIGIDLDLVERPRRASLLGPLQERFIAALRATGLATARAASVAAALPISFEYAVWALAAMRGDEVDAELAEVGLAWPEDIADRARRVDIELDTWLPVFTETFGLCQIYQPPRGLCHPISTLGPRALPEQATAEAEPSTLVDVHAELRRWMARADREDAVRIVSGDPGAGKSSLAQMFAAERSRLGEAVVLIPLHRFDPRGDLRGAVRDFVGQGFDPFDPRHRPLLLILDGLDEFALRGDTAARTVAELVDHACLTAAEVNRDGIALRILLLGRELVVQGLESRFRRARQVIRLLPLRLHRREYAGLPDPDGVRDADQRHGWWRRYGELTGEALEGVPPELEREGLAALTEQPLLNLLLAIVRAEGAMPLGDPSFDLGALYAGLIRQVYDRVHAGPDARRLQAIEAVAFEDYERFLWAIAEAAWHGAGRTASLDDIQRIAGPRLLAKLKVLTEGAADRVSRLMTAFYFRAGEGVDTFEFTHQSFAEYLLARRLVDFLELMGEEVERYAQGRGTGWSVTECLARWYRLFGPAPMEQHVITFLEPELRRRPVAVVAGWQKLLGQLIGEVVSRDFPAESAGPRLPLWQEQSRSCDAGSALLAFASVCSEITGRVTPIADPALPEVPAWVEALTSRRHRDSTSLDVVRYLSRLDLRACRFDGMSLAGANLHGSHLAGAWFVDTFLTRTRLTACDLSGVRFESAVLRGTDFSESNMEGARFIDLHFQARGGMSFAQVIFRGIAFYGANLNGVGIPRSSLFIDCVADTRTRWPEGFDPVAAGIRIEDAADDPAP